MKSKNIIIKSLALSLLLSFASCADTNIEEGPTETKITVTVNRPADVLDATVLSQSISFLNIANQRVSTFEDLMAISLLPGLYDVTYTAELQLSSGAHSTLRAKQSSVQIDGGTFAFSLEAYNNIETDDLIIAEIFFSGTVQASGNSYVGDDYIKLYNNTDHVIYADGLTFFQSKFLTTKKLDHTPDIMATDMNVEALYTIPGSGTDHPVQPGEFLLLADTGIDHRVANPNSFDLSHADFEWYDVSTKPTAIDIDSPTVPNLDKVYCYTLSYFMLHNRGFKAFGIARIPVDSDTYLRDYHYDYDFDQVTLAGTFPMSAQSYRIPNEWIVDVVNCSVESEYAWNVCTPALDCGWTHCGSIDKDKDRFFRSVRRKLLYINDAGNPVLKDTNNSAEDFNPDCIASEIELQGTAIDAAGTPCTQLTYDGLTPVQQ